MFIKGVSSSFYPWLQTHRLEQPHNWWLMRCPYPAAEAEEAEVNADSNESEIEWRFDVAPCTIIRF